VIPKMIFSPVAEYVLAILKFYKFLQFGNWLDGRSSVMI